MGERRAENINRYPSARQALSDAGWANFPSTEHPLALQNWLLGCSRPTQLGRSVFNIFRPGDLPPNLNDTLRGLRIAIPQPSQ